LLSRKKKSKLIIVETGVPQRGPCMMVIRAADWEFLKEAPRKRSVVLLPFRFERGESSSESSEDVLSSLVTNVDTFWLFIT